MNRGCFRHRPYGAHAGISGKGIYHFRIFANAREVLRSTGCSDVRSARRVARELQAKWIKQVPVPKQEPAPKVLTDMSIEQVCELAWKAKHRIGCHVEDSAVALRHRHLGGTLQQGADDESPCSVSAVGGVLLFYARRCGNV